MSNSLFQEYFKAQATETQVLLNSIYQAIKQVAPDASEKMSYGMPTLYLKGNLVHFAAYKNHIGFYPAPSGISNFLRNLNLTKPPKARYNLHSINPCR